MLAGYRVLDLTEGGCLIAGQMLGDLGADVIQIEPPGGSPSRSLGPFYKDVPDPEKSLFWFSYCSNKRGITLNLGTSDGRDLFKRLVKTADVVLQSFHPGFLDKLALGYADLCSIKPDIILTSITHYGVEGPKSGYKGSDLTTWAASVLHYISGDPDRPPAWISWPSASLNGGIQGAFSSLFALWHREMTGEGQHVDAPIQPYLMQHCTGSYWWWECMQFNLPRMGRFSQYFGKKYPYIYDCKDGYVNCTIGGGTGAGVADSTRRFVQWMDEDGMAPDWLKQMDWLLGYDGSRMTQEEQDRILEPFQRFLLTKTKAEVSEETAKRGIICGPVCDAKDIFEDRHLEARGFWADVEHPELGETLLYHGPFVRFSEAPMRITRRAPLLGEHNQEVFVAELGLSKEDLVMLRESGVV